MSKALPKISRTQRADTRRMHKRYVRVTYKNGHACLYCGHQWKESNILTRLSHETDCPKCKSHLHLIDAPKNTPFQRSGYWLDEKVYGIIDTHEGYQVVRYFMSTIDMVKGRKHIHDVRELAQHWISADGKVKSLYVGNSGCMYNITWGYGKLQFRGGSSVGYKYGEEAHKYWKVKRFIPMLRRNGIKSSIHDIGAHRLFIELLKNPKIETLFKAKYYGLVTAHIYGKIDVDNHWESIKIALRNNFNLKADQWSDWKDLLGFLTYLEKDIRNAKYVCPASLKESHKYWMHRQNMVEDREREIERVKDANYEAMSIKEKTAIYQKEKGHLLGLIFTDGDIVIQPLKTVQEFVKAGKKLDHCVGKSYNAYYQKQNSLILSAKCKKELVETIEVSLKDFTVLQSRGYDNDPSKHNGRIVKLMEKNMNKVRQIA